MYKHVLSLSVMQKALMADIAATRELCVQLDHSKDSLTRQLASHAAAYEQVGGASSEHMDLIFCMLAYTYNIILAKDS